MKRLIIQIIAIGLAVAVAYFISRFFAGWDYSKRIATLIFWVSAGFTAFISVAGMCVGLFLYARDNLARQKAARETTAKEPPVS